ncbi:deazapurine DNA modification protein DpdA family protein [Amycolatopsis kentuckyensis]|uniref:deazapurine DNA modification protein DpdA family protein n=1 Tax=Amycolatopsis kentuckyensis TaxID=218823 RepID=UPI00356A32EA
MNVATDLYLGISEPSQLIAPVPVCIAHHRLQRTTWWIRRDRPDRGPYMVDSGAYSALDAIPDGTPRNELEEHGYWRTDPREYVSAIAEYHHWIGPPTMVGIQDWMCEDHILAKTGLTVGEHQDRTVANYLELTARWDEWFLRSLGPSKFVPTLQGDTPQAYVACIEKYRRAGVDLLAGPVGVGSLCRRQSTREIIAIISAIVAAVPGIDIHAYGVKTLGIRRVGHLIKTSDTESWSVDARYSDPLPACVGTHQKCTSCLDYALLWRDRLIHSFRSPEPTGGQLDLFGEEFAA